MLFQRSEFLSLENFNNFDVIIKCGDKSVQAHRLVLAAASPLFRAIFQDTETDESLMTIILANFESDVIVEIINFLYGRQRKIEKTRLLKDLEIDIFDPGWIIEDKINLQNDLKDEEKKVEEISKDYLEDEKHEDIKFLEEELFGADGFVENSEEEDYQPKSKRCKRTVGQKYDKTVTSCTLCQITLESITALGRHFENEHACVPIPCDKCDFKTDDIKKLYMHVYRKHKGNFLCDDCDYQTNCKSNLQKHVNVKHKGLKFKCDDCDFETKSRDCLKRHKSAKHEGRTESCNQCEYQADSKADLRLHKKQFHQKQYMCDQCQYVAKNLHNLKVHKLAIHQGHKYMCDQCEYSAKTTISLTEHIKVVHQGIKKLCDQCDYVGSTVWSLRKHKEKHHDKIRVYCDKCQYSTTFKSELNHHIKIVHEGYRYYCNLCDYSSQKKIKVKRHKQSRHEIDYKPNVRDEIPFKPSI